MQQILQLNKKPNSKFTYCHALVALTRATAFKNMRVLPSQDGTNQFPWLQRLKANVYYRAWLNSYGKDNVFDPDLCQQHMNRVLANPAVTAVDIFGRKKVVKPVTLARPPGPASENGRSPSVADRLTKQHLLNATKTKSAPLAALASLPPRSSADKQQKDAAMKKTAAIEAAARVTLAKEQARDTQLKQDVARAEQAKARLLGHYLERIDTEIGNARLLDASSQTLRDEGAQQPFGDHSAARAELSEAIRAVGQYDAMHHLEHARGPAHTQGLLHSSNWSCTLTSNTCPCDPWLAMFGRILNSTPTVLADVRRAASSDDYGVAEAAKTALAANEFFLAGKLEVR